ncbi:hypothetical protein Hanom_Chr11g01058501 [Helianthus anomalus]
MMKAQQMTRFIYEVLVGLWRDDIRSQPLVISVGFCVRLTQLQHRFTRFHEERKQSQHSR